MLAVAVLVEQLVVPQARKVRLLPADKVLKAGRLQLAVRVGLQAPRVLKAVDKPLQVGLKHKVPKPGQQRRINLQI